MSLSRIDYLKENLQIIQHIKSTLDEKMQGVIENILRALGRFESYRNNFNGIENLITKTRQINILFETLQKIHHILREEVKEQGDIFKSGNIFWDCLTSYAELSDKQDPNPRDEEISSFLEKLSNTLLTNIAEIQFKENQTLEELKETLNYLHNQLIAEGLTIFLDMESRILSANVRKTQTENYAKIKISMLTKFYEILLNALKKVKTIKDDEIIVLEYNNLYHYFCIWMSVASQKSLEENAEMQIMLQALISQFGSCGSKKRDVIHVSLPSYKVDDVIKQGEYKAKVIIDIRDFNKHRNEHPDTTFENRILPHHGFLGTSTFRPAEGYKPKDLHTFLTNNLYTQAVDFYVDNEELMPKHFFENNNKLKKIYATLKIIPQLLGLWQDDRTPLRSFHFIRFVNQLITKMKKVQFEKLNLADQKLLTSATENAWVTILRLAHQDIPPDIAATEDIYSNNFKITEQEIFYYKLVEEQQYLFLVAEFLVIFSYFKIEEISQPSTGELIKEHFDLDQTNLAGILDLVLNRCKTLEEKLVATKLYKSSHKIVTQQDIANANNNMNELLNSLKNENEILATQAAEKLAADKKRYRTGIKNCRKVLSRFFKNESNAASSTPPITECKEPIISKQQELYLIAGRLRQATDVISEEAINKYLEVVSPFEHNSFEVDKAYDYFYIAASYAELADCFIRKADQKVPNDYANGNFNFVPLIKEEYNKALQFAKNAYRCFIEKIEPCCHELDSTQLKDFHDLSKHIKFILKSAEEKLRSFMQFCEQSFIQLQEAQKKLQQGRLQAMRRFTREEWVNRINPSNFYSNLHKTNQEKIANLLQSHHEIQTHLNTELKPIGSRFAYLVGGIEPPFPLLTSGDKKEEISEEPSNNFVTRLKHAASNDRLLKPGSVQHNEERLRLTA